MRVILIEALDRILLAFDPGMGEKARQVLEKMGVEVRLKCKITSIDERGVWLGDELIETANVVWSAGAAAPPLTKVLGAETDRMGRVKVSPDCSLPGHPEVFVVGDAAVLVENNKPLPALAPVALQQGRYVADIIKRALPAERRKAFRYHDKGFIAVIGRAKAVMQYRRLRISGFLAWLAWIVVHIAVLVQWRNRYAVTTEWAWYYIGDRPGVRLITGHYDPKCPGS